MKNKKKLTLFILLIVFITFINPLIVSADHCSDMFCYYLSDPDGSVTYDGNYTYPIYGNGGIAYCAQEMASFDGSTYHSLDNYFSSANNCQYKENGNGALNEGDCSKIIASIINEGQKFGYYWTQAALWGYLGFYTGYGNYTRPSAYYNSKVQQIISQAFKNYSNSVDNAPIVEKSNNLLTIQKFNYAKHMYYVPSDVGKGYYRSGNFFVGSKQSENSIKVIPTILITKKNGEQMTTLVNDDSVKIMELNSKPLELDREYGSFNIARSGSGKIIYLKVSEDVIETGDNIIQISFDTTMKTTEKVIRRDYDSVRYSSDGQAVFQLVDRGSSTKEVDKIYQEFTTVTFVPHKATHKLCNDYRKDDLENGIVSGPTSEENPVVKGCVNNYIKVGKNNNLPTKDKYEANFSHCSYRLIDLGKNKKVKIRIYENTSFRYGVLNPISSYPGGGFRFAKKGESITTDYASSLTWRYVDFMDGRPYYYNGSTKPKEEDPDLLGNVSNLDINEVDEAIHAQVNEEVKKLMKKQLNLEFVTWDSNDATKKKNVVISNNLTVTETTKVINGLEYTTFVSKTDDSGISMNPSWFNVDGSVSYNETDGFPISGGNYYYIPTNYRESKFPFNIKKINLSILDFEKSRYSFLYEAKCEIEVDDGDPDPTCVENCDPDNPPETPEEPDDPEDFEKAIVYRPIDLDNPFPRANSTTGEGIKENWRTWYSGSDDNKTRLKRTFTNYPNAPLYSVTMDDSKINKIVQYRNLAVYTNWNSINEGGNNSFIDSNGFEFKYPGSNSYCPIGKFGSYCDE